MPFDESKHYEHRFHAGNVGDVWKHVALLALLERLDRSRPHLFVDTHAGAGSYALGPTGEWSEGVGRLVGLEGPKPRPIERYLELAVRHGAARSSGRTYPGSPAILAALAGPGDRVVAFELDPTTERALREVSGGGAIGVEVRQSDGLAGLESLAREAPAGLVALVDPPYADRREWQLVPEAILRAIGARAGSRAPTVMLWYPIKSWSRPNAMLLELEKAGASGTAVELITSPLTSKKNRLNGSGLVLFSPPDGLVEELSALGAWLGPRLAVSGGFFTLRTVGFGASRDDGETA